MFGFILRALLIGIIAVPLVFIGLILSAISFEPMIPHQAGAMGSYQRAEQWLNHARSAFDQDKLQQLSLDAGDIADLVFYSSSQLKVGSQKLVALEGVKSDFFNEQAIIRFTWKVRTQYPLYLNISLSFSETQQIPRWDYLEVGRWRWSGSSILWVIEHWFSTSSSSLWPMVVNAIESFDIRPHQLSVAYRSEAALLEQLKVEAKKRMSGSLEEQQVFQLYLDTLAKTVGGQKAKTVSLAVLFTQLFKVAKQRTDQGESAIEENARVLRVLALQVADSSLKPLLVPGMKPPLLKQVIVLRGKEDLAQHFLVSAALALTLDEQAALNIGISKEHADAKVIGSGFSMADLVADMAGIAFASAATESENKARKLQALLLSRESESIFMPKVNWLPPGLSAESYRGLIRHPLYPAMLDKIVKRLNELPVNSQI